MTTDAALASHAPYEWSYAPTLGALMHNTAQMICRQLVGHVADKSPEFPNKARTFAIMLPNQETTHEAIPGVTDLISTITACGANTPKVVYFDPNSNFGSEVSPSINQLKSEGITSVIYVPWFLVSTVGSPQHVAKNAGYQPEWIMPSFEAWPLAGLELAPGQELSNTFGVAGWNKLAVSETMPWYQTYAAAGGGPISSTAFAGADAFYHQLMTFASGIQAAGPHLTPVSFSAALHGTSFPNPGSGRAPTFQAAIGGDPLVPTMVHDFLEFWIDPRAGAGVVASGNSTANPWDMFCYVGLGTRAAGASWPQTDSYKKGRCR